MNARTWASRDQASSAHRNPTSAPLFVVPAVDRDELFKTNSAMELQV